MKNKKSFYVKKISAVALAFAVGITSIAGNTPAISKAASTFSITKKATIGAGETYQLATKGSTKGITFKSSDKKIVSVSKSGKIKGKKTGKATITAKELNSSGVNFIFYYMSLLSNISFVNSGSIKI